MFKFDVYFRNIEVINNLIRKSLKTLIVICYHTRNSLTIKIIKKLHFTVQKSAGCCMYPCDVISSVADSAVKLTTDSNQFWDAH